MLKSFIIIKLIILFFFSCVDSEKLTISEKNARIRLNVFYKDYIVEKSKMPVDYKKVNSLKNEYCTKLFLNQLQKEELDFDPFLNAQDWDVSWINKISINRDSMNSDWYVVSFVDNNVISKIRLHLIIEDKKIKIDEVKY